MEEMFTGLGNTLKRYITPSEDELATFTEPWEAFSFEKNTIISDYGQTERYFYYVHEGLIRGYFIKHGVEYNIGFSYNGDYSGIYDSFISQQPATWTLETIDTSKGLRIEYNKLMALLDNHKFMERWLRLFYQQVLVGFGIFTKSILADSAEEKFNRLINQSPHVVQMIPQKHLASYLGMTPETFSRMRKKTMN